MGNLSHRRLGIALAALLLATPALAGCLSTGGTGVGAIYVKDAPSQDYSHVNVTFTKVMVHQGSGNASGSGNQSGSPDTSGSSWKTVYTGSKTVDLLAFNSSDARALLGQANLTAGTYNSIVITVQSAYAIKKSDGSRLDLTVTTGWIKINRPWKVASDHTTRVIIDLNLDRSIVQQGNGQARFNPVVGHVTIQNDAQGPEGNVGGPSGSNGSGASAAPGMVSTYVKDRPTANFSAVYLTLADVQVHLANATRDQTGNDTGNGTEGGNATGNATANGNGTANGASDGSGSGGGSWVTVWNGTRTVNLLNFSADGARAFLGSAEIPSGHVTQIRLNVTDAWAITGNGTRVNITVTNPEARIVRSFDVQANGTTRVVLDVNLDRSLHGGHGAWRLTPVIGNVVVDHPAHDDRADVSNNGTANPGSDHGNRGGNATGNGTQGQPGTASVYVKDAPTANFTEVWLTFTDVQVHLANASGNGTDGGWVTLWNGSRSVNLLNFSADGARAFLGSGEAPSGRYTQIRFNVTDAWAVTGNGTRVNLTVTNPEVKIVRTFDVAGGNTTRLVIDVNLNQSLHGGHDAWRLTPVVGQVLVDHPAVDDQADHANPA